jgi:5-methylcytosine-specific restriction endonuclease McrA
MANTRPRERLAIMRAYSLSHLSDPELKRDLTSVIAQDRTSTAWVLAHLAEFDARRLYLPEAYPSMFDYCVHKLRLSEDAAYKRIRAARAARQFPVIFEAVADGRLHLSAVVLLSPYLTPESAEGLLAAAAHKTKAEIEELLARRFPRSEAMGLVVALPAPSPRGDGQLAPGPVAQPNSETPQLAPAQVGTRSKLAPVAAERFLIEATVGRRAQEKLRYIQDLLGHELPSGDLAQVLEQAFDALIEKLEKRKFAATKRPRRSMRPSANPRHIPAQVKRAVWERDRGQCTFVSEAGRRCPARKLLEFDHVEEVARGGRASVAGIRLRCRAHNQYGAECTFGVGFMREKREEAQRAAEARKQDTEAHERARAAAAEVIAPLRELGFRADEARRAAALCEAIPEASLEQRVRRALTYFHPPGRVWAPTPNRTG